MMKRSSRPLGSRLADHQLRKASATPVLDCRRPEDCRSGELGRGQDAACAVEIETEVVQASAMLPYRDADDNRIVSGKGV